MMLPSEGYFCPVLWHSPPQKVLKRNGNHQIQQGKRRNRFIDPANSQHFHLVHRSQRDLKCEDPDVPQYVLLPGKVKKVKLMVTKTIEEYTYIVLVYLYYTYTIAWQCGCTCRSWEREVMVRRRAGGARGQTSLA